MARQPVRLTYQDYVHFPAGRRWELIKGQPHPIPPPNRRHQEVLGRLFMLVARYLDANRGGHAYIGPIDVVLREDDVFQPDLVYVSDADADVLTEANIWGTPTWVVEVLSDPYRERDKLEQYEAAHVPEHWLVNPYEDTLAVSLLDGSTYAEPSIQRPPEVVRPHCLPGLDIDLASVLRC